MKIPAEKLLRTIVVHHTTIVVAWQYNLRIINHFFEIFISTNRIIMKIQYFLFMKFLFFKKKLCENYFNICQNNVIIVYTIDTQKETPHTSTTLKKTPLSPSYMLCRMLKAHIIPLLKVITYGMN
jgi:hypothetical protein